MFLYAGTENFPFLNAPTTPPSRGEYPEALSVCLAPLGAPSSPYPALSKAVETAPTIGLPAAASEEYAAALENFPSLPLPELSDLVFAAARPAFAPPVIAPATAGREDPEAQIVPTDPAGMREDPGGDRIDPVVPAGKRCPDRSGNR